MLQDLFGTRKVLSGGQMPTENSLLAPATQQFWPVRNSKSLLFFWGPDLRTAISARGEMGGAQNQCS